MHSLSASRLIEPIQLRSRSSLKAAKQTQKCKVSFSREYGSYPNDPLLLAQSLTAKSREFVHQHQDSSWQQSSSSSAGGAGVAAWAQLQLPAPAAAAVPAAASSSALHHAESQAGPPWQQQQQQVTRQLRHSSRHVASQGLTNSSSSSSGGVANEGWIRKLWPLNGRSRSINGSSSSSAAGVSHQLVGAAAVAAGADAPTALEGTDGEGSSNTTPQQQQQQQRTGAAGSLQRFSSSNGSGWSYYSRGSSSSSRSTDQVLRIASNAWLTVSDSGAAAGAAAASSSMPGTDTLGSLESPLSSGEDVANPGSSSSSGGGGGRRLTNSNVTSHRNNATNSHSPGSADDADWLTAVLSVSTSKLSVHSNAVLTNSLKRLASLRLTGGSSGAAAAAAAAAAVEGPEGLVGLLESVRVRFASFGLQHFEEVALQLGQLGYQPEDEWLASFERHSMAAMPGGSPRLLSRLLLARSKLPGGCSAAWCEACLGAMTAQPERLTVSSWVNALWALVRLKHAPGRSFQAVFFSSTASRLDDVSPELLTNLTWSLARLQLQPSYLWWRSLVNATAGIEKAFSHSQLASLIHSVALWAEPGGIHMRDVQRLVDLLLVEVDCQLAVMQPGELTTILWSLGSMNFAGKYAPDFEVQDALLDAIQGQLPRLNPGQLASLCWGLAKLQHRLPKGFAEALLLEVQAQVQGFSDAGLANVMWALARLGLQPGAAFSQALWEELHTRCGSVTLQDLSTLLWAIARLSLQPPADLLSELTQQSLTLLREVHGGLTLHAANFTATSHREGAEVAESFANMVCALGQLQATPDSAWTEEMEGLSLLLLPRSGLPQLLSIAKGLQQLLQRPPSAAWQAACLREVRLRCRCSGVELDCRSLAQVLAEVGVSGLAEGAAAAEQTFSDEENALDGGYCAVEFQPGCR